MSKRKLNDDYLDNHVGQHNPTGKRPKANEAYPNEIPISHKFFANFKKNNIPLYFTPGAKGYRQHHQTIKELQQETKTPPPGVVYKFPVVTESTVVVSADGKPVLFFIKDGLQLPFNYTAADKARNPHLKDVDIHQIALDAISNLTTAYPPPKPKLSDKRHIGSTHLSKSDKGLYHFAFWQEGGKGHQKATKADLERGAFINEESYPSKGKAAGQVRNLGAVFRYHAEMTPIFQAMGTLFELLDPVNYERYKARYRELAASTDLRLFNTTSKNCFLGSALLIGLECNPHKDTNDVMDGWVMDAAFGEFEGGNLQCHQLGLEFKLGPKDVVMMRSRLLTHGVAPVTKGKRYSTVLFSHDTLIKTHSEMLAELELEAI